LMNGAPFAHLIFCTLSQDQWARSVSQNARAYSIRWWVGFI
jgi:hypothetical protein